MWQPKIRRMLRSRSTLAASVVALLGVAATRALWQRGLLRAGESNTDLLEQAFASVAAKPLPSAGGPPRRLATDFQLFRVTPDGRCMFRSLALGSGFGTGQGSAADADALRSAILSALRDRRQEVEWFLEEPFDQYIARMSQAGTWGGEPELLMAQHVLSRPIWVWMKGTHVDASRYDSDVFVRSVAYGEEMGGEDQALHLSYSGTHYDLLRLPSQMPSKL